MVLAQPDDTAKTAYLNHLMDEIYLRDIIERNNIRNEAGFSELVDALASGIIVGGNVRVNHDENGITIMGLKQFLLDRDSLN